jgi:hypothetical protein
LETYFYKDDVRKGKTAKHDVWRPKIAIFSNLQARMKPIKSMSLGKNASIPFSLANRWSSSSAASDSAA